MTLWSGLWVPKGTPKEIVAKLNAAAVEALSDPAVIKQLENLGLQMPPKEKSRSSLSATAQGLVTFRLFSSGVRTSHS